jgi:hypothetical protein
MALNASLPAARGPEPAVARVPLLAPAPAHPRLVEPRRRVVRQRPEAVTREVAQRAQVKAARAPWAAGSTRQEPVREHSKPGPRLLEKSWKSRARNRRRTQE